MKLLNKFFALTATLALVLGTALPASAAWTVPSGTPPTGNVTAPINTGNTFQTKTGGIDVAKLATRLAWIYPDNLSLLSIALGGNLCNAMSLFCVINNAGNTGNPKGLGVASNGDVKIGDGTAPVAGRVLTQNASGVVSWGPSGLPPGTADQTLRYDGPLNKWVANDLVKAESAGTSLKVKNGTASTTVPIAQIEGTGGLTKAARFLNVMGGVVKLVIPAFQLQNGNEGQGKVLVSDATGNADWSAINANTSSVYSGAYVVKSTGSPNTDAYCTGGDILIAGGGHCSAGNGDAACTNGRCPVSSSEPGPGKTTDGTYPMGDFDYWHVDCTGSNGNVSKTASAYAICMPASSLQVVRSISVGGTSGNVGGSGGSSAYSQMACSGGGNRPCWSVPLNQSGLSGQGTDGQQCLTWVRGLVGNQALTASDLRLFGSGGYEVGHCAYQNTNGGGYSMNGGQHQSATAVVPGAHPTTNFSLQVYLQ